MMDRKIIGNSAAFSVAALFGAPVVATRVAAILGAALLAERLTLVFVAVFLAVLSGVLLVNWPTKMVTEPLPENSS